MLSVYQAELPAHGSRGFSGLFVKSGLWGRRRDVHTVLGWFEPGLQAPLAKAFTGLSGLYATKLRYGGHAWSRCALRNSEVSNGPRPRKTSKNSSQSAIPRFC